MDKKIIFLLGLLALLILIVVVYASKSTQLSIQPLTQVGQVAGTPTQTIKLKISKGWNLVTLGIIDKGSTTCSSKDLLVLYGYDPLEKKFVKIGGILSSVSGFYRENKNYLARSQLNSGWLYSTKDCEITNKVPSYSLFTLETIQQFMQKQDMKFPTGWNFFSVAFDMVCLNKNSNLSCG